MQLVILFKGINGVLYTMSTRTAGISGSFQPKVISLGLRGEGSILPVI